MSAFKNPSKDIKENDSNMTNIWGTTPLEVSPPILSKGKPKTKTKQIAKESETAIKQTKYKLSKTNRVSKLSLPTTKTSTSSKERPPTVSTTTTTTIITTTAEATTITKLNSYFWSSETESTKAAAATAATELEAATAAVPQTPSCMTCTSLSPTSSSASRFSLTAILRKFNEKDNGNNNNKSNNNNTSHDMYHQKYNNATIMSQQMQKEQQILRNDDYHQQKKYQSKPQQQQQQQHPHQQNQLSPQWLHTCFLFIVCVSLPQSTNMQPLPSAQLSVTSSPLLIPLYPSPSQSQSQSQSQSSVFSANNSNNDSNRKNSSSNSDVSPGSIVSASFQQSSRYTQLVNDYHDSGRGSMHFVSSLEGSDGGGGVVMDSVGTDRGGESNHIECPSFDESSACPCYKFEDGLFLECPGTTTMSLRTTLERITSPIHSLSIYDFDRSVTSLSPDVFQPGVNIRHLQFSHSHLEALKDNSLRNVRTSLESLSIVNGKLTQIPARALNTMQKLNSLDFDSNEIVKIDDYSFYGLRLSKLNMKGNKLQSIPEHGFVGLEEYMQEIDLSENRLRTFPMLALRKLDHLRTLRLSNNQISRFYGELVTNSTTIISSLRLSSLVFLDLSSNKFTEIADDCFRAFPQLKTLSLYANQIELVQSQAFKSLKELMSLDMSHNRIITLDAKIFAKNKRLQTIDLSHNHIHSIGGVFAGLPQLREIFLSENNILELPADAFTNSSNIDVIYLESNAIAHIDPNVFSTLVNLDHLYLRANFIPLMPVTLFDKCLKLTSLTLDNNEIQDLEIGMFRKLEYLREVRLHNNRIRRIRKGVFEPLPRLQELHVQKNNIEDIEPGAFRSLFSLQHINLQDNHLTILEDIFPTETGNASSLLSIQLESNYLSKVHVKTFQRQTHIQIMWLRDNSLNKVDKYLFMDLKELGRLYLSNNQIRDIERDTFSNLQQLRLLELSVNHLKLIRREYFAELINLEELILSHNAIEAIEGFSFNKLKKLKVLDLSHNPLVQLTRDIFMDDLAVTHLYLQNTSLHKIELHTFKSLQNLNELNFEQNFLSPADIQRLDVPSLRSLQLSQNNFSEADTSGMFDKLRSLQQLSMANCSLSAIPEELFIRNTNLVKLDLCDNWLATMNRNIFNGLNVFKELRLCHNRLHEFPHIALYNLSTLESLDLSRNQLTSVDFFKLSGTPNLRQLKLKDNKISTLSGFNAVNLTQLDSVDLSGNMMLSLPANFLRHSINLQRVDLSSNRFLQIPSSALADVSLPRLSWLNLTGNPINKIYTVKEERYPHLKELYICQTNLSILTSKDFEAFQALQHLHLVNNRIMRISPGAFRSLINLLTLDIGINELEILPKERLQGLKLLRFLNISHNTLKDLEEFSSDLAQLQIIDLSYNQLDRISKKCFRNLDGLMELYLMGNRMTVLSADAFRTLSRLSVLDLRKNYFELIPIDALKPLETNIKTLRLEDNPLHCSCDAQKLWEWLRDHRKWSVVPAAAATGDNINYLRCEHPAELRGKVFAQMDPQQFCDAPLIPKIAIQDIQPYSVLVSWQSREHLGLNGYEIVYHAVDGIDGDELPMRGKRLNGSANSAKLTKLMPNIRYHICVIGSGNWLTEAVVNALQQIHFNDSSFLQPHDEPNNQMLLEALPPTSPQMPQEEQYYEQYHQQLDNQPYTPHLQQALVENTVVTDNVLQSVLKNSHISACTDVQTLDSTPSLITDENGLSSNGFIHGLLTRRLGLIVGCCLGIIVFIVMISVLSYVKLKKQRIENAKRQQTMPPEYISYRHFSIPNEELVRSGTVMSTVPSGISAHISGTSLNTNTTAVTTPIAGAALLKSGAAAGIVGSSACGGATACAGAGTAIVIKDGAITGGENVTAATPTGDSGNGCVNLTTSTVMPTANDVAGVAATMAAVSNASNNHNNNAHHSHYHHHHNYLHLKQQPPKQQQQQLQQK